MKTQRFFFIVALVAAFSLALAACGGGASTPAPLNITIHGKDIAFDVTAIEAKVNQTIKVTYINDGALEHTFLIDNMVAEQKVAPGQTITFSFTPSAAGTFEYYCNVPGHREALMIGTLTVVP